MLTEIKSQGYSIFLGDDLADLCAVAISISNYSQIVVLVDDNTYKCCFNELQKTLGVGELKYIKIPAGEVHKNLLTLETIWSKLTALKADRKTLLLNLGGGMVSDIGGLAATTYKRGIPFINMPTSLLAMVDASVGGKVGIDWQNYKNHIGLFAKPQAVVAYTLFLATLPTEQLQSGWAEVIKHGLIADKKYFNKCINSTDIYGIILPVIEQSINIKNKIVKKDFEENYERKSLNFGHTIGHAIESISLTKDDKPLLHGQCVAIGMICEAHISFKRDMLAMEDFIDIYTYLFLFFGKFHIGTYSLQDIFTYINHDKKNTDGLIKMVLLHGIGKVVIDVEVEKSEIISALDFYKNFDWQSNALPS